MLETIAILIAFIGSVIAAIWDLFTTEVPDEVLALMAGAGISIWFFYGVITTDFAPLVNSVIFGTGILAIGWLMYKKGHWGGADACLFASIAYLIPFYSGTLFMPTYIFNFLLVGAIYMVIYALVLGIKNRWVFSYFVKDVRENSRLVLSLLCFVSLFVVFFTTTAGFNYLSLLLIGMVFFWRYGVVIEKHVFRRRVKTKDLRVGDVVENMIWRGITEREIKRLQKKRKYVVIKEGVRFIPAFPIALVLSLLYGNLMFLFFSL